MMLDDTWRYRRFSKLARQSIRNNMTEHNTEKKTYTQQSLNNKIYMMHRKGFLHKNELTMEYELMPALQSFLDDLNNLDRDVRMTIQF
jgi:hypothetical protein